MPQDSATCLVPRAPSGEGLARLRCWSRSEGRLAASPAVHLIDRRAGRAWNSEVPGLSIVPDVVRAHGRDLIGSSRSRPAPVHHGTAK